MKLLIFLNQSANTVRKLKAFAELLVIVLERIKIESTDIDDKQSVLTENFCCT